MARPTSLRERSTPPEPHLPPAEALRRRIDGGEVVTIADYMAAANASYYASRDPFGAEGDFVTAPEISQMFGELIGLWLADLWLRAGQPATAAYVELGPGRGTLAADALRAMRGSGLEPPVHLVETSPVLQAAQRELLPGARWHEAVDSLPSRGPLLIVANEFFDALAVRQWVADEQGWRELVVARGAGAGFARVPGPRTAPPPFAPPDGPPGTVVEARPEADAIVAALGARLAAHGGVALIIDYGHDRHATGDTLQAVSRHGFADPWTKPGEHDLTAHVDFAALAAAGRAAGLRVDGPVGQGPWLKAMGIDLRAASLAKAAPERAAEIAAARERLTGPEQMGRLFRVLALVGKGWPAPEGF
jgi:NADH dehydrogenase [ubiquinone] 1 alpha subcomplex assembly factor 7